MRNIIGLAIRSAGILWSLLKFQDITMREVDWEKLQYEHRRSNSNKTLVVFDERTLLDAKSVITSSP